MSEHLIAARAALADEIAAAQGRIDRANAALELLGADVVPLVRPPADDVPAEPVTIPKRETRPKPTEQRPAAKTKRKRKYDYDEIAAVACQAHAEGRSMRDTLVAHLNIPIKQVDTMLWKLRKEGYAIPRSAAFTAEPITRMPVDQQPAREATAGPWAGPVKPISQTISGQRPVEHTDRPLRFSVDDAVAAIEATA